MYNMSINKSSDKQTVVCSFSGILLRKEQAFETDIIMKRNLADILSERNQTEKCISYIISFYTKFKNGDRAITIMVVSGGG